jgi:succinate dehydrogenase hydrophobic anchor subunit
MSSKGAKGWLLQRVSGSLLFFTLATHFYIYHYFMGPGMWGFDSIGYGANDMLTLKAMAAIDPSQAKYFALANLFSNPVWKAFDVSFITLACYHGFYGIRSIVDDWVTRDSARTIGNWVVYLIGILLWVIGVVSVISFNPQLF